LQKIPETFSRNLRIVCMMEEAELISAINNGIDRYGELVERYHVGLIIHCEQLVGDRDEAEDIAQEAFVKAYLQLKKFDPHRARFSTWLYKIATNLALDYLRRNKRHVAVDDVELLAETSMPTHLEDEEKDEVQKAVRGLDPPEYRQVIEAYYWNGKSYQEIADELHIPLNTLRTWVRRAKLQLREDLS
jgi:RNA polymerase sigma-70 factor, ECF subfamily